MSEVNVVFRTFTFEHGGKSWELERQTLDCERAFAKHLEGQELALIQRHTGSMGQLAFTVAMDGWRQDCGPGNKYGWNRPQFHVALDDKGNAIHLLYLWFLENHERRKKSGHPSEPLTEKQLHDMFDADSAPLIALLQELLSDPNRSRPQPK